MTDGDKIAAALNRIAFAIEKHAESVDELARCTRLIAYGEKEPTGLEAIAMCLTGSGLPGNKGQPDATCIAGQIEALTDAIAGR